MGIVDLLAWLPYAVALALDSNSTLGVALRMLQAKARLHLMR